MTRLLVTGDRNWKDREYVFNILDDIMVYYGITHVIEGCARGLDRIVGWPCPHIIEEAKRKGYSIDAPDGWAFTRGLSQDHFPADWDNFLRAAGPIRNRQMLKSGKPHIVAAFHKSLNTSKGTKDMVTIARKANIPVFVFPSATE